MPKHDSGTTNRNKLSRKNPATDAIQMLKDDHRKVEALFVQFLEAEDGLKPWICEQIFHELEVHSTLEEELFYPALQNPNDTGTQGEENDGPVTNMIINAYDEHRVVRDIIGELRQKDASSPEFQQTMIELQQAVEAHVFEEEDELFAEAQLTVDTPALGLRMQQRKQEILSAV
jgi:hemerythrin superfamily protein